MTEIRLVPLAVALWAAAALATVKEVAGLDPRVLVIALTCVVAAGWVIANNPGQAIFSVVGAAVGLVISGQGGAIDWAWPWSKPLRERFSDVVTATVGPRSAGLIPGMVLGDTSAQTPEEADMYVAAGLSHLTAVSGSNVAIIGTCVVMACRALALGPRVQTAASAIAIIAFVGVVGTEPSVLRATIMGLVGLIAVVSSSRMQAIHGLSLAIILILLIDPTMAISFGFTLSVAATLGIVGLTNLLAATLERAGLPRILARALAVAIAADAATMPVIAMVTGEVSVVSVMANVIVEPAVTPVTVLGLIAAIIPWPPLIKLIEPFTWWIARVAEWATTSAPVGAPTIMADPLVVIVIYGWIIAAMLSGRVRLVAVAVVIAVGVAR